MRSIALDPVGILLGAVVLVQNTHQAEAIPDLRSFIVILLLLTPPAVIFPWNLREIHLLRTRRFPLASLSPSSMLLGRL